MDRAPAPQQYRHLREYFWVIRRHKWVVAISFLGVVATVAVGTYLQTPIYEAVARVLIENVGSRVAALPDIMPVDKNLEFFRTQVEVIRSRPVVQRVIDALDLTKRMPALAAAVDPVSTFLNTAVFIEPVRDTRIVEIRVDDPDPKLAAEAANALASAYVNHNLERKQAAAQEASAWLGPHVNELESKATASQLALQKYREQADLVSLEEKKTLTERKLEEFNAGYVAAKTKRLETESRLMELRKAAQQPALLESSPVVLNDPLIQRLKGDLVKLEAQQSELVRVYTERYPDVLRVKAEVEEAKQKIREEVGRLIFSVESEHNALKAREAAMLGAVSQYRDEAQSLEKKKIQHGTIQREAETNLHLYEAMLKRAKEAGLSQGLEANNVSIVEQAVVPSNPIKPRRLLNMALAVVLGLVLAPAVAFFIEYMDDMVRSPEEVEATLGAPVFGRIPSHSTPRARS